MKLLSPWIHDQFTRKLKPLDGQRDSVTSAEAQRRDAALQIPPLQFVQQSHEYARAGCTNRMAKRDSAAIYVYFCWVQPQLARDGHRLHGKRFVQFNEVNIAVAIPSSFLQQFFDGLH